MALSVPREQPAPPSDRAGDLMPAATVALGAACVLWRAAEAARLPAAAWPYIVADLLISAAQTIWIVRLALAPSTAAYRVGGALVGIPLLISISLSTAAGTGAFGGPIAIGLAQAIGIMLNGWLLTLTLIGSLSLNPGRAIGAVVNVAVILAALSITALVGGVTHEHRSAPAGLRSGRVAVAPLYFCHLL